MYTAKAVWLNWLVTNAVYKLYCVDYGSYMHHLLLTYKHSSKSAWSNSITPLRRIINNS